MKTKFFLFVSLVLLAVQGWATPDTQSTGSGVNTWNGVELTEIPAHYYISNVIDGAIERKGSTTLNGIKDEALPIIKEIIQAIFPVIWFKEVDENVTFEGTTVGTTITKKYQVWGHNTNSIFFDKIKLFLYDNNNQFPCGVFSIDKEYLDASSIDVDEGGHRDTLTVSYSPTEVGEHSYRIVFRAVAVDRFKCDKSIGAYYTCMTLPDKANINGSAVERTITTNKSSLSFFNAPIGETRTEHFTVTGKNLTGPLTLTRSGDIDKFWIYPAYITAEDAEKGVDVTVNYMSTAEGNHHAQLAICGGNGYPEPKIELIGSTGNPTITVDPPTWDFGAVNVNEPVSKKFTVTGNNLNAPISIDMDLETNGGEYTFAPTSLPPSGGTVTVTFKPVYNGSSGAAFTLTSGQASAHFAVTGTCVIPPHISPSTTSLDFGTVDKGKEKTKTFNVAGTSLTGNLTLTTNSSYYTVSPATITPAEARTNPTVTVTYKPTAGGNHDAILSISGGGADSKTINLSGKCVAIDVTPSTYDFGTVNKGEEKTKKFTVIGTNLSAPISIDMDLETNGGEYTFSPTSLPSSGGTVTVTFKPVYNGSSGAAFTLTSGQASGHFAVTGTCIKPNISVNPTSLAFGNVVKGNNPTKTFKVTGTDLTGNLTVSSSNSTYFTVSPTTITAAQAKTGATVTVTYKASAEGSHSGTITISGGGASPQTVNVSGKCVVPAISVSPTSIAFGTVGKGQQVDKSFWVTGSYLTGSLTVSSNNSNFIVSPTSISAAEAAEGKMVTVTYKPTAVGSHSGTITISGGGASPKTVSVSGKCVVPEISVSTTSLLFEGNYDSRTFRVTGTNLTGSLTLTSNNSIFTVTPSTITASQAANGVTVKVQCNAATNIQRASGKITISGGGASPKYVNLTLDASNVQPNAPMVEPEVEGEDGNDKFINGELLGANGSNTASVHELEMNSKVYADRLNIIIESPVEQKAVISDIAGHIREVNLQAGRNEIPVNASGIYIIRIREKSTKLMLK